MKTGPTSRPAALTSGITVHECVMALSDLTVTNVDLSFRKDK
ncbi:unnamed protein product, partial [Rotaria sp. Silwood1]